MRTIYIAVGVGENHPRSTGVEDDQLRRLVVDHLAFQLCAQDEHGKAWTRLGNSRGWVSPEGAYAETVISLSGDTTIQEALPYREEVLRQSPDLQRNSTVELYLSRSLHDRLADVPARRARLHQELAEAQKAIDMFEADVECMQALAGIV